MRSITQESVAAEYVKYRPLLLRAISILARNGFAIGPADALDIVHDFFLEQWNRIAEHFDPEKGSFEGYLYRAFIQFARPRIVRIRRFQSELVDPAEISRVADSKHLSEDPATHLLWETWRDALLELNLDDRQLIQKYLGECLGSERQLARQLGLSRYVVRERLIRALGESLSRLRGFSFNAGIDTKVAESLWQESRTFSEAAAVLGMTVEQVRRANARNVGVITNALRAVAHSNQKDGNMTNPTTQPMTPQSLLYQALLSPGNEALLREVRCRANEIVDAIDTRDIVFPEPTLRDRDNEWIARVYDALAGEEEHVSPEFEELTRQLVEVSEADLATIGAAFKQTLLPGLPTRLVKFDEFFRDLPRVSTGEFEQLTIESDVKEAFPESATLAIHGLRPSTFFYATEAVSGLLERMVRYGHRTVPTLIDTDLERLMMDEVSKVTLLSEPSSTIVCKWLFSAAEYKPLLFSGFESERIPTGLLLQAQRRSGTIYQRWAAVKQEAAEPIYA